MELYKAGFSFLRQCIWVLAKKKLMRKIPSMENVRGGKITGDKRPEKKRNFSEFPFKTIK